MQKIFDGIFSAITSVCKVMMLIQVASVTTVFIGRYIFNHTPPWAEELTLLCLVWMCLIGASIPMRSDSHLRMTIIDYILPKGAIKGVGYIADILILIVCVILFIYGVLMTIQVKDSMLYGIGISRGFLYGAVPTSMVFFALAILEKYYKKLDSRKEKEATT